MPFSRSRHLAGWCRHRADATEPTTACSSDETTTAATIEFAAHFMDLHRAATRRRLDAAGRAGDGGP